MADYKFPSLAEIGPILILGLGQTGLAAANWCAANGVRLYLADTRAELANDANIKSIPNVYASRFGPDVLADDILLDQIRAIVLSPGLNPNEPELARFLAAAAQKQVRLIGEIELFALALKDLSANGYQPVVLAVTGTNGKTTVTSLLGHLVRACGKSVRVAGNISPAALNSLKQAVDTGDLPEYWVLELSSFQLHTTSSLVLDAAVVLNLSQDHLDWHGSMANYAADKKRLLDMAKIRLVNRDDELVLSMVADLSAANVRSFGADKPVYTGDFGLQKTSDIAWLAGCIDTDSQSRTAMACQNLMPAQALPLIGQHNVMNVLAALCMANAVGLALAALLHALRSYHGQAHRTEFIRSIAGVDFIDDSKGTNIGATVAALQGIEKPIILIAGGLGKGQDFSLLADAVKQSAKSVCLIGQDAQLIASALAQTQVPVIFAATMDEAVNQSFALAQPGDVVLLSPACASMDMFNNYIHRAECFVDAVQELALDHGEVA